MVSSNASFDVRVRAAFTLAIALLGAAVLTGCGIGATLADDPSTYSSAATTSGVVHGGQLPIAFSTVQIYAAGSSGYGAGSTLLATTTTSSPGGNFSFTKSSTNGPSSGTGNTWACPATTADPVIYLIAQGGNSLGNGLNDAADTNSAIALLDVLGPCSQLSGSQFVILNEVSTVASVFALAPYINPGTSAGTEVIGTNGLNVPTSKPQGAVGLVNAVAAVPNLMAAATTYTGTSTSTLAIQVTATPEAGKVNTIADILAACINTQTVSVANAICTQLFNGAISLTGTVPVDTIQAAYFMATNPVDLGTQTSCSGGSTNIACLYGLASSSPPFQPTLSAQPTDWTIGVTYSVANYSSTTGTGTCNGAGGGGLFFDAPTHASIDANGNIWIINQAGSGTKAAIVEMSPVGVPLLCATPSAQTYGSSLTIDPTGNVWGLYSHNGPAGLIQELPYNSVTGLVSTTPISYTPPGVSPLTPTGIVADGSGNIFFTTPQDGGTLYEYPDPGTSTTAVTAVVAAAPINGTSTMTFQSLAADTLGRIWGVGSSTANLWSFYPASSPTAQSSTITAYAVTSNVVTFTSANTFAPGQTVKIAGLTTSNGTQFNGQTLTIVSSSTSLFTAAFTTANVSTTTDSGTATEVAIPSYTANGTVGLSTTSYGLALSGSTAAATYIYTGTTCCGSSAAHEAEKFQSAAAAGSTAGASSTPYLGGNIGARGVAVDGAGNIWSGQEFPESTGSTTNTGTWAVAEVSAVTGSGPTHVTFSAISPTGTTLNTTTCTTAIGCPSNGGFQKTSFLQPNDLEIDTSGNVWVLNTGSTNSAGTFTYVSGGTITEIVGAATPITAPLSVAAKNGTLGARP